MDYKGGKKHLICDNGSLLLAQRNGQILEKILDLFHLEVFPTTKAPLQFIHFLQSLLTFENREHIFHLSRSDCAMGICPWSSGPWEARTPVGLRLSKPQTPAPGQPLVGTDQPGNWVTPRPGRPLSQRLIWKWFEVKSSLSRVISISYFGWGFPRVPQCCGLHGALLYEPHGRWKCRQNTCTQTKNI